MEDGTNNTRGLVLVEHLCVAPHVSSDETDVATRMIMGCRKCSAEVIEQFVHRDSPLTKNTY